MQLTERDKQFFEFINQFGFCETLHLCKRFNLTPKRINQLTRRLVVNGYLIKEKTFFGQYALYRLTAKGAEFTSLPPLSQLSPATYHHTTMLIHVYLELNHRYPKATWQSERMLLDEKSGGVGKLGHNPDALLILEEKHIAIEIERSAKSKRRLEGIIKSYATNFSIQEVWYFCSNKVLAAVTKIANQVKYVKVFALEEFIGATHAE
jgi:predicted transcriptional regulator